MLQNHISFQGTYQVMVGNGKKFSKSHVGNALLPFFGSPHSHWNTFFIPLHFLIIYSVLQNSVLIIKHLLNFILIISLFRTNHKESPPSGSTWSWSLSCWTCLILSQLSSTSISSYYINSNLGSSCLLQQEQFLV